MDFYFWFAGSIISSNRNTGPKGITVTLKLEGKGDTVQNGHSEEGGVFSFRNVLPGKYTVEAKHEKWLIEPTKASVAVVSDSVVVPNAITVVGYDVQGRVLSDGEPTKGVKFLLYSQSVSKLPTVACNRDDVSKLPPLRNMKPLCHMTSSESGHFRFPALPCGEYFVVPFYRGENNIKFDLTPAEMAFTVDHDSLKLKDVSYNVFCQYIFSLTI